MIDANDPRNMYAAERTLLAAERTLLAWNRTSLALMGFGFLIERFGLYVFAEMMDKAFPLERLSSFLLGLAFIVLGIAVSIVSVFQYKSILRTLKNEIPHGYSVNAVILTNVLMAIFGTALTGFLLINYFAMA